MGIGRRVCREEEWRSRSRITAADVVLCRMGGRNRDRVKCQSRPERERGIERGVEEGKKQ